MGLALLGIAFGLLPGLPKTAVSGGAILLVFVPPLVFEAVIGLNLRELRRVLLPVSLLATVGVGITVALIGVVVHLGIGLDWTSAFLLGAILSPTDPIAVVTLVRMLRAPAPLAVLLEGESLFNDGTGVAVFAAVLATAATGRPSVPDFLLHLLVLVGGGVGIGVAAGLGATHLLRRNAHPASQVAVTVLLAYGSYLLAVLFGFGGVIAVVAAALMVARLPLAGGHFWAGFGFLLNAALFFIVGAELPDRGVVGAAGAVLLAYAALFAGRAVPVYLLLAVADPWVRRLPWRWRHLAFWGGLRGALSIALALSVAGVPHVDPRLPTIAYGAVVLSLLLQGGLLQVVFRGLRLAEGPQAPEPQEHDA